MILDDQTFGSETPSPCPIPREFEALWNEAGEIWDRFENREEFRNFVAADYQAIYAALVGLKGRAHTILEWGSGLGVIAIMASHLGFDAYGIEIEPKLVELSRGLAEAYGSSARFATGSYVPEDYRWSIELGDGDFRTSFDDPPAYDELDMELRDFDIVYVYPWPNEQALHHDIMRKFGGPHALFLSFDVREGVSLKRLGTGR